MRNMGIVRGNPESATPFEICIDTVYLRFNIEPAPPLEGAEDDGLESAGEVLQWHEIQYDLREWFQFMTETVIDISSFTLNDALVKELEASVMLSGQDESPAAAFAYVGQPEQKPFTFTPNFTQRKS